MDGVLVIDKPSGPTSFDVVRTARMRLGVKKVGHTGTLDPLATGVLPVCLGAATKISSFILEGDKTYEAVIQLGIDTDTLDAQGAVTAERPVPPLTPGDLEQALARFRGTYLQLPPMYSAVKIGGRKLYELARAGEEIDRPQREVTVHGLELVDFAADRLTVRIHCAKGFFVRSLASDLGALLGCGGHVAALRRTSSGPFSLAEAVPLSELEATDDRAALRERVEGRLHGLADALSHLPAVRVSPEEERKVRNGVPVELSSDLLGRLRLLAEDGRLLAVAEALAGGRLKYLRVMA